MILLAWQLAGRVWWRGRSWRAGLAHSPGLCNRLARQRRRWRGGTGTQVRRCGVKDVGRAGELPGVEVGAGVDAAEGRAQARPALLCLELAAQGRDAGRAGRVLAAVPRVLGLGAEPGAERCLRACYAYLRCLMRTGTGQIPTLRPALSNHDFRRSAVHSRHYARMP
jgi:hypothetical protein